MEENEFQPHTKKGITLIRHYKEGEDMTGISISQADENNGHPKKGDMIGRSKTDENDCWLINQEYYNENYELAVTYDELRDEAHGK